MIMTNFSSRLNSLNELVEFFKNHPSYMEAFANMNPSIVHRSEIERQLYRSLMQNSLRFHALDSQN